MHKGNSLICLPYKIKTHVDKKPSSKKSPDRGILENGEPYANNANITNIGGKVFEASAFLFHSYSLFHKTTGVEHSCQFFLPYTARSFSEPPTLDVIFLPA